MSNDDTKHFAHALADAFDRENLPLESRIIRFAIARTWPSNCSVPVEPAPACKLEHLTEEMIAEDWKREEVIDKLRAEVKQVLRERDEARAEVKRVTAERDEKEYALNLLARLTRQSGTLDPITHERPLRVGDRVRLRDATVVSTYSPMAQLEIDYERTPGGIKVTTAVYDSAIAGRVLP